MRLPRTPRPIVSLFRPPCFTLKQTPLRRYAALLLRYMCIYCLVTPLLLAGEPSHEFVYLLFLFDCRRYYVIAILRITTLSRHYAITHAATLPPIRQILRAILFCHTITLYIKGPRRDATCVFAMQVSPLRSMVAIYAKRLPLLRLMMRHMLRRH